MEPLIVNGNIITLANELSLQNVDVMIVHSVNCIPMFGPVLSRKIGDAFPLVEKEYLKKQWSLGDVQIIKVKDHLMVANVAGQLGVKRYKGDLVTDLPMLKKGMQRLVKWTKGFNKDIKLLIPVGIGCGNGGEKWERVLNVITSIMIDGPEYILVKYDGS